MNKEQMLEVQNKIVELEKLLMRDLEDSEIEYLSDHTICDFLYNRLGFDTEDIEVLKRIRKIISDWCTKPCWRPAQDDIDNESDFFTKSNAEDQGFENVTDQVDFFKQTAYLDIKVKDTLKTILNHLESDKKAQEAKNILNQIDVEQIPEKRIQIIKGEDLNNQSTFDESQFEDPVEEDLPSAESDNGIEKLFPESFKKWLCLFSIQEIVNTLSDVNNRLVEEMIKKDPSIIRFGAEALLNQDEVIGEAVDELKDKAILKYVKILSKEEYVKFNDDEIQSEVLDYLSKHNYKVKSINNKVSIQRN